MPAENENPERLELLKKLQQRQRIYAALLNQQDNTRGAFPGQQYSAGLGVSRSQIEKAKQAMDDAETALNLIGCHSPKLASLQALSLWPFQRPLLSGGLPPQSVRYLGACPVRKFIKYDAAHLIKNQRE